MKQSGNSMRGPNSRTNNLLLSHTGAGFLFVGWVLSVMGCATHQAPFIKANLIDLKGQPVNPLLSSDSQVQVFLFAHPDCPISNRYAPEVRRLYLKFAPKQVDFWLVYPDPDVTPEMIRQHMKDYDYRFGALKDPRHTLVKLTGAQVTPEAAVFTSKQELVYRGRIDNRYVDFGKYRPEPTEHDLEEVLEAVLAGKPSPKKTALAVGCYIVDFK